MIFVMLGTNPYSFERLLTAVDAWAMQQGETVIAQTGHTPTDGIAVQCHDFLSHDAVMEYINAAELVICQGGFGSLRDALAAGKPVLAVPRLIEKNECQDSQREIVDALGEQGRVLALYDMQDLGATIQQLRQRDQGDFKPSGLPQLVADSIDEVWPV